MKNEKTDESASVPRPVDAAGSENQLYICGEMNKYKQLHPRRNDCAGCYHGKPHHFTGRCYNSCSGTSIGEKTMCKPCDPNPAVEGRTAKGQQA